MSAISKPTVSFTNSENPQLLVPTEDIAHAEPINYPNLPNNPPSTARYGILISLKQTCPVKSVLVTFTTQAARDTSMTNLKTYITQAIA